MTKTVRDFFSVIGVCIILVTIFLLIQHHKKIAPSTIIETDTITIKRDSLINELKNIEHEENKVIKEVMVLSNDSSLKLFKVLVSE